MSTFVLMMLSVFLNAASTFLVKTGLRLMPPLEIRSLALSVFRLFTSPYILGGLVLLPISFISYSFVLQRMNLSVAYPLTTSLVFAVVVLISVVFFNESISVFKVVGLLTLIMGAWLLTR